MICRIVAILVCINLWFISSISSDSSGLTEEQKQININCRWCHKIVMQFQEGYDATKTAYKGSDNSQKLGKAEMQLAQIMERLCSQEASSRRGKCHSFVEENEELLENWFLNIWWPVRQTKQDSALRKELFEHFCVEQKSLCCGDGHYGPNCLPCEGYNSDTGVICSGHGTCNGNQTYKGTGKCECFPGYAGEVCDKCDKKTYEVSHPDGKPKQEGAPVEECRACHPGCSDAGCTSFEANACFECGSGWKRKKEGPGPQPCVDINECKTEKNVSPCPSKDTFCQNLPGSYKCIDCSPSCARGKGCTGPGAHECAECNRPGYAFNEKTKACEDVDECEVSTACKNEGESCHNTVGSFHCDCPFNQEVDPELKKCMPRRVPLKPIGRFSANSPGVTFGSDDDDREHDEF